MAVPAARKALTPGRENARCPPYSDRRAHDRWPEARRRLRTADIRTVRPAGVGGMTYMSRSEEHTSELQSLMRISYAVFCLKKINIIYILYACNDIRLTTTTS